MFFIFITRRGLDSKSEVSIDNESKRWYLDEGKGGLPIIVVVKLETFSKLVFGTSLFSILLLLMNSLQDTESKITSIMDARNIWLILHVLITWGGWQDL